MISTKLSFSNLEQILNYDQREEQLKRFDADQRRIEQEITPTKLNEHTRHAYQHYVVESRDDLDRDSEKTQKLLGNEINVMRRRISALESMENDLKNFVSSLKNVKSIRVDGRKRTQEDKIAKYDRINVLKSKADELYVTLRPLLDRTKSSFTVTEEAWKKVESSVESVYARKLEKEHQARVREQIDATRDNFGRSQSTWNSIQGPQLRRLGGTFNQGFNRWQPPAYTSSRPIGHDTQAMTRSYAPTRSGRRLEQLDALRENNGLPRTHGQHGSRALSRH
jgi:hypothetical protein